MLTTSTKASRRMRHGAHAQFGSTLIEVLVAMVLLAFGLLGLAAMYNYAIGSNKSASSRLQAAMLAQDYAEMVRANPDGFSSGGYDHSVGTYDPTAVAVNAVTATVCAYPNCTADSLATTDVANMERRVRAFLPAGAFHAARVDTTNQIDIWMIWSEAKGGNPGGAASDAEADTLDRCPDAITSAAIKPSPFPRCLYVRVAL